MLCPRTQWWKLPHLRYKACFCNIFCAVAVRSASPGHGRAAHGLELTVRDLYEASAQCWKNAETVLHSALSKHDAQSWAVFSALNSCLRDDPVQTACGPELHQLLTIEDYCDDITAILVDLSWVHEICRLFSPEFSAFKKRLQQDSSCISLPVANGI